MTHETYLTLAALSHNEELSPELREAIRRELGDRPTMKRGDRVTMDWGGKRYEGFVVGPGAVIPMTPV